MPAKPPVCKAACLQGCASAKPREKVKMTPSLFHVRSFGDELLIDAVANPRLGGKRASFIEGDPLHAAVLIGLYAQIVCSRVSLCQIRHIQMQMRAHIRTALFVPRNRKYLNRENPAVKQQLCVGHTRFLLKLAQCHRSKIGFAIGMPANP